MFYRLFVGDESLFDQSRKALIKRVHPVGMQALSNRILDLAGAQRVLDHFPHAFGIHHDFERRYHALSVRSRQQSLRHYAAQYAGKRETCLLLLVGREHRSDSVDRFGCVNGVQRR